MNRDAATPGTTPPSPKRVRRVTAKVLIAEDNARVRRWLERVLTREGYQVRVAEGGRDALACLHDEPDVAVLVTDIVMPEVEGLELIRVAVRQNGRIGVVAISGDSAYGASELYLKLAADLGAHVSLAKPFGARTLLEAVAHCVGSAGERGTRPLNRRGELSNSRHCP